MMPVYVKVGRQEGSRLMRLCGACRRPAPTYLWVDSFGGVARLYEPHNGLPVCHHVGRTLRP